MTYFINLTSGFFYAPTRLLLIDLFSSASSAAFGDQNSDDQKKTRGFADTPPKKVLK